MDLVAIVVLALTSVIAVAVGAFLAFTYINKKVERKLSDLQLRFMDEAVRVVRETSSQSSAEAFRNWSNEKRKFLQDNTPQLNPEDLEGYLQTMDTQSNVLVEMWRKVFAYNQEWTKELMGEEEESQRILENAHRLKEEAGMMNLEAMRALDNATSKAKAAEEYEAKTKAEMESLVAETKAESERVLSEAKAEARGILASAKSRSEKLLASLRELIPLAREVQDVHTDETDPNVQKQASRMPTNPAMTPVQKQESLADLVTAGSGVHNLTRLEELAKLATQGVNVISEQTTTPAEKPRLEWDRTPTNPSGVRPLPREAKPTQNGLPKVEAPTPGVGSYRTTPSHDPTPATPHPAATMDDSDDTWALVSADVDAIVDNLEIGGPEFANNPEDSNLPVAQGKPRLQVVR